MAKSRIHITPELLRRYVAGEATASEQHAVERAALEDPFISDALEGVEAMAEKKPDLKALYDQLDNRVSPTPILKPGWKKWALAASFAGLVVTGYVLWTQLDSPAQISQVSAPPAAAPSRLPASDSLSAPQTSQPEISMAEQPLAKKAIAPADAVSEDQMPQVMAMKALPDSPSRGDVPALAARSFSKPDSAALRFQPEPAQTPAGKAPEAELAKSAQTARLGKATPDTSYITVVNEQHEPIAGATIRPQRTNRGVVTNPMGRAIPPHELDSSVVISAIGYQSQTLPTPLPSVVTLVPDDQALTETVVVGYGEKKEKSEAQPGVGYAAYQTYLKENLHTPKSAQEKSISGTVILSAQVKADGSLGEIKVKKGLGYGCEEEAIRLVKKGPGWIPARRKGKAISSWVKIEVPFP